MVTRILTNMAVARKRGNKGGVVYRSPRIYLPTKLTDDSSFPFLEGDQLVVKVTGERVVVELSERAGRRRRKKGSRRGRGRRPKMGREGGLRKQGLKRNGGRTVR